MPLLTEGRTSILRSSNRKEVSHLSLINNLKFARLSSTLQDSRARSTQQSNSIFYGNMLPPKSKPPPPSPPKTSTLRAKRVSSHSGVGPRRGSAASSSSSSSPSPSSSDSSSCGGELRRLAMTREEEEDFARVVLLLEEKLRVAEAETGALRLRLDEAAKRTAPCTACGGGARAAQRQSAARRAPAPPFRLQDLDAVLRSISELNALLAESSRAVDVDAAAGAGGGSNLRGFRCSPPPVAVTFFLDGFRLDCGRGRLRPYDEPASVAFLGDLRDGFFPAELQGEYPDGVALLAADRRGERGGGHGAAARGHGAFAGAGRSLQSRCDSRSSGNNNSNSRPESVALPPLEAKTRRKKTRSSERMPSPSRRRSSVIKAKLQPLPQTKKASPPPNAICRNEKVLSPFANSASGSRSDKCVVRVLGAGDAAVLVELVAYDTVRTLRGLLCNHLRELRGPTSSSHIKLFAAGGAELDDDSRALGEVGLAPRGVVHVSVRRK